MQLKVLCITTKVLVLKPSSTLAVKAHLLQEVTAPTADERQEILVMMTHRHSLPRAQFPITGIQEPGFG